MLYLTRAIKGVLAPAILCNFPLQCCSWYANTVVLETKLCPRGFPSHLMIFSSPFPCFINIEYSLAINHTLCLESLKHRNTPFSVQSNIPDYPSLDFLDLNASGFWGLMLCSCNGNLTLKIPNGEWMCFTVALFTCLLNWVGLIVSCSDL